jgi:ethanolamine ammonia-lyase large subunit
MLDYQSLSFHDVLGLWHLLNLQPAPESAAWLSRMALVDEKPLDSEYVKLRCSNQLTRG